MQADMVLEEKLRVLHLAGNRKLTETLGSIFNPEDGTISWGPSVQAMTGSGF